MMEVWETVGSRAPWSTGWIQESVRVGKALDGGRGLLSQLKTLWTRGSYMSKDIVFSFPDASISP